MSPTINVDIIYFVKCPVGLTQAQHNCGAAKGKPADTIPSVTNQQSNVVVMGVKNPWVKHFLQKI